MIDFSRYEAMTFDCYGTLIDWEAGILAAVAPLFAARALPFDAEGCLREFGGHESRLQTGAYLPYREVLGHALVALALPRGFAPSIEETARFAASVADWPAFPDSAAALASLKRRFRLGVVSNVDDDLFAHSARRLGSPFDWIVTAEQTRVYKPSHHAFTRAFATIGVPMDRVLHVAQSRFHDIAPARELGLATVWVNRRGGSGGGGATPPSGAVADLEVPDLATLAARAAVS